MNGLVAFLNAWQTLIAGGLALVGAIITVRALNKQSREATYRKARALRAMLPNTLSAIDGYAIETIRWLKSVREKAGLMEQGQYANQSIAVATVPRPDAADVRFLQECVEHFDGDASKVIATLLSKVQVQYSRTADFHDYFVNYPLYEVKPIGLAKNIDTFIADSVELVAYARQLYPFARFETDGAPSPPNADAAMAAFHHCHMEPTRDTLAWNELTNRYLETAAKGAYRGKP